MATRVEMERIARTRTWVISMLGSRIEPATRTAVRMKAGTAGWVEERRCTFPERVAKGWTSYPTYPPTTQT